MGALQALLAGDLIARVVPVWIRQRGILPDKVGADWLLVGAGRADEDILRGDVAEDPNVALDIVGAKRDPIHDRVEMQTCQRPCDRRRIVDIRDNVGRAVYSLGVMAAVEQKQLDALLDRQSSAGAADQPSSADIQDFHPRLSFIWSVRARAITRKDTTT